MIKLCLRPVTAPLGGQCMYQFDSFMSYLERKNPSEPEFIEAASEVVSSVLDWVNDNPYYIKNKILERITEPDRVVSFKVEWEDDEGNINVNRGWRVQFNNALGPYKGGLRFHSSVTEGTLKFLAFEQIFKNSLTGLPMGGGKGGSDFSPKGRSDEEIRRFCNAFMRELYRHIGPDVDVPAGDVGVGKREIGYLFGEYKRLTGRHEGVLTGKGLEYGGSPMRPEATGYGALYFAREMLQDAGMDIKDKRVALSGFGNVAWGAAKKASEMGAKVVTLSGPDGYVLDEDGVSTPEKWAYMLSLRSSNKDVVEPYAKKFGAKFFPGLKPWREKVDIAMPSAIQNELSLEDAKMLEENGVNAVVEVSNMGLTRDAADYLVSKKVPFAPGKAANAGGVAVSGLEMSQNAGPIYWNDEEIDGKLKGIMKGIHSSCLEFGREEDGYIDYRKGANIAGFIKVADAMCALGY